MIYGAVGFFGAAYYGSNTEQNILVNQWLGGGVAQGILNLSMAGMVTKIFLFPTLLLSPLQTTYVFTCWFSFKSWYVQKFDTHPTLVQT